MRVFAIVLSKYNVFYIIVGLHVVHPQVRTPRFKVLCLVGGVAGLRSSLDRLTLDPHKGTKYS